MDALRRGGRGSEPLAVPEVGPDQNQVGSERRPEIAPRASNLPILACGWVAWRTEDTRAGLDVLIVGEIEDSAAAALALLYPQDVVRHRNLAHLSVVIPNLPGRECLPPARHPEVELRRKRSQKGIVLGRADRVAQSPLVVLNRRGRRQRGAPAPHERDQVLNLARAGFLFGCRQLRVLVGPETGDQIGIPASRLAAKRGIGAIEKVEDSFERQIGRGKVLPAQVDSIETNLVLGSLTGIVAAQPPHQLEVFGVVAKPVAEGALQPAVSFGGPSQDMVVQALRRTQARLQRYSRESKTGHAVADQAIPHRQRFVAAMNRLAEPNHAGGADHGAERPQVRVIGAFRHGGDGMYMIAHPVKEGLLQSGL